MTAQPKPTPKSGRASAQPDSSRDLAAAVRVLGVEAEGLRALAASLDQTFSKALDLLSSVKGRIVVTGMGKSGHIGSKIAATLASTGSPAMYVHPAEASHGDLGMIVESDAVLALSNSGDTPELADIIAYTRRFRIPLGGDHRRQEQCAGHRRRCSADPAFSRRSLPHGPGADDVDHHDIGAGRCHRGGAAGAPRLHGRRISACCIPAASWAAA